MRLRDLFGKKREDKGEESLAEAEQRLRAEHSKQLHEELDKSRDGLVAALGSPDVEVRREALWALAGAHYSMTPELESALFRCLKDSDEMVRAGAIDRLTGRYVNVSKLTNEHPDVVKELKSMYITERSEMVRTRIRLALDMEDI